MSKVIYANFGSRPTAPVLPDLDVPTPRPAGLHIWLGSGAVEQFDVCLCWTVTPYIRDPRKWLLVVRDKPWADALAVIWALQHRYGLLDVQWSPLLPLNDVQREELRIAVGAPPPGAA